MTRQGNHALTEALAEWTPSGDALGYAVSPQRVVMLRYRDKVLQEARGDSVPEVVEADLAGVYELVLFTADETFRWAWSQRNAMPEWTVFGDAEAAQNRWETLDTRSGRLIRGHVTHTALGWSRVHDGSSQALWVAHTGTATVKGRLKILAVEYVDKAAITENGNVGVVAERLIGIEVA